MELIEVEEKSKIKTVFFLNKEYIDTTPKDGLILVAKNGHQLVIKLKDLSKEVQDFLVSSTDLAMIKPCRLTGINSRSVNIGGVNLKKGFDKIRGKHTLTMFNSDTERAELNYRTKIKPVLMMGDYGHGKESRECHPIYTRTENRKCKY